MDFNLLQKGVKIRSELVLFIMKFSIISGLMKELEWFKVLVKKDLIEVLEESQKTTMSSYLKFILHYPERMLQFFIVQVIKLVLR